MCCYCESLDMRIGYVRPSPWYTAKKQIAALVGEGRVEPDRIYVEGREGESLEEAIHAIERGDELCVASACRLTNRRQMIAPTLDDIHEKGAVVIDVSTGHRSPGYHFMADAIAGLARDRGTLTTERARELRKLGGRAKAKPLVPIAEARRIWKDLSIPLAEALERIGVSKDWAYRNLRARGSKAGRPRKKR